MALARSTGVLVVVSPGPMAKWALPLLTKAAAQADAPIRHFDRTDPISAAGAPKIFVCQFPSLSAINAVTMGALDAVYVMADPQWTVAAQRARGASLLEALRLSTASATANLSIGRTSRSRLIYPELDHSTATAAQRLLSACGLPADPAALHENLLALGMSGEDELRTTLLHLDAHASPAPLDETESAITQSILGGLAAMAEGESNVPVIWPTAVFLSGDAPNSPAPMVASIVGPSRVVLYGPYLHLPPATYRGEVTIAFSGHIEEIAFHLDFLAEQTRLTSLRMEGRRSGNYRGRFKLVVTDPAAHIEIHLRNERGSIEGEVALRELRFYAVEPDVISIP